MNHKRLAELLAQDRYTRGFRHQDAACHGKEAFDTASEAYIIVHRKRRPGERKKPREAYRCPFCGKWHLGSKTR